MSVFDDAIQPTTEDSIRQKMIAFAQSAGLNITNWSIVDTGVQILEATVSLVNFAVNVFPTFVRGFTSLDLSTDPGDFDQFDPNNISRTPAPGLLSEFGKNTFGTTREEANFATGFVLFQNNRPGSITLTPGQLVHTWTGGSPPSPAPTYINTDDPTIYISGSVTVPAGTSISLPVACQILGAIGSAPPNVLSLTTALTNCTSTNPNPIVGNDRETKDSYIAKCRQASSRVTFANPSEAYAYFATKNADGTPLLNDATTPVPTSITRVQIVGGNGTVSAYYATSSGAAISDDVTAANTNIEIATSAVADAITFTGIASTNQTVHVQGTAKIRKRFGITAQGVAEAIVAAMTAGFSTYEVGGKDQDDSGNGFIYTTDIRGFCTDILLGAPIGLYDVEITLPAVDFTALPVGHVPVLQSFAGDGAGSQDWLIVVVP